MKFFLDSAKLDEINLAYHTLGIDGVTTNPRHIMASGQSFKTVLTHLGQWVADNKLKGVERFPISVELNPHLNDTTQLVAEALKISALCENFVIKLPCSEASLMAARELETKGIKTNVTLVFSPAQAIWAAKTKAQFVSPFIGWKEDNGESTQQYIHDIVNIYKNYHFYGKTQIICAAVRSAKQIADCAVAGADIVTTSLAVYQESMKHAYTKQGLEIFCDAWDNTKQ